MVRSLFPSTRKGWILATILTIGAGQIFIYADFLGDPKRWLLVLLAVGFFAAPVSSSRLNFPAWLASTALVAWVGRYTATLDPLLLVLLSFFGSSLVVRGGERARRFYFPANGAASGRWLLLVALTLFFVVFVADGFQQEYGSSLRLIRFFFLLLSAASFVSCALVQSKRSFPVVKVHGVSFVSLQRWPYFVFVALLGWSPLPQWIFSELGERSDRSLHLTAAFLMLFATAIFVAALLRIQRRKVWPRKSIRWASFIAGIFLAHALFAYLVDFGYRSDPLGGGPFSERAAQGIRSVHFFLTTSFLIVLPFVHERTSILQKYDKLAFFVATPVLAAMNAPLAAINGDRWNLASTGFLYCVTLIIAFYYTWVTFKEGGSGKVYVTFVVTLLLWGGYLDSAAADSVKSVYKLFVISTGFVLYAVDLFDRAGDSS
jgi:hypothetical protein